MIKSKEMKKQLLMLLMLVSGSVSSQLDIDQTTPEKTVRSFFNAFHAKDTVAMKTLIHQEIVVGTVMHNSKDTLLKVDDAQALYISLSSIPDSIQFKEELTNIEVQDEGLLAQVWTPYAFFVDDKESHRGVNSFTLINSGGKWKIIYLVDTRRRD